MSSALLVEIYVLLIVLISGSAGSRSLPQRFAAHQPLLLRYKSLSDLLHRRNQLTRVPVDGFHALVSATNLNFIITATVIAKS